MHDLDFIQLFDSTSLEDFGERLRQAVENSPENAADVFDNLALEIARRYRDQAISYEDADFAMNSMHGAMCNGRFFEQYYDSSRPAIRVFFAFDEGEYRHNGDDDLVDPVEKYTKPMINMILNESSHV